MKNSLFLTTALSAFIATGSMGCSRKPDAKSELEKAAAVLENPAPTSSVPPPTEPSANPVPTSPPTASAQPTQPPAQQVRAAMAAYKAGNLEDAVTRLQKLRATPAMSPQQRIALNDAMAAVMNEIYALAAKGDSRAAGAVKQYEQMQTQRR